MNVRHSILVITYNQEKLFPLCLNSILEQSIKPYEIVICDDFSTDNTWRVVQEYAQRYPDIIKAHRNNPNLGVFENVNKIKTLSTGDFINFVSGDDMLPSGALEGYTKFIEDNGLDCLQPFVIITDCIILSPNGKMKHISNKRVMERYEAFESTVLNCLWGWDTGLSRGLLEAMSPMELNIGYQADLLWHLDKMVKAQKHFYIPTDGYIYRANTGVTAATKLQSHFDSKLLVVNKIYERYPNRITPKMRSYFDFDRAITSYFIRPNMANYWHMLNCYFKAGKFRPNNVYRYNFRILLPIGLKNLIKKMIGRE